MTVSQRFVPFVVACALGNIQVCNASTFLGGKPSHHAYLDPNVQRILFGVELHFGGNNVKHQVAKVEELMSDVYNSLAKNKHGRLGSAGVRYALHRLFAQKHGWLVEGLDANGGAWNGSSPTVFLQGRVPTYLQDMFEEHLAEHGFGLHEVALLAVSLEHLVHAETIARLEASYAAVNLTTDSDLTPTQVHHVLEASFMVYLFETKLEDATAWVDKVKDVMDEVYPGWQDTLAFLRDEQDNLAYAEKDIRNPFAAKRFNFENIVHVAEGIHDKYGHFQNMECFHMKNELLVHEHKSTGRILLSDFYGLALAGDWRYSESVDYLRQLGALDESDSSQLSVIVPNYVYGKSMCLAASSFYSVCCLDECERLLGHLEHTFLMPTVEPSLLAVEVSKLASSTVPAPRNLSTGLRGRLYEIAAMHGGVVPLHGRMFAQFLNHAYPRECPFPHMSDTTNPLTSMQWMDQTNMSSTATDEVIQELGRLPAKPAPNVGGDELDVESDTITDWHEDMLWMAAEELVVMFKPAEAQDYAWTRVFCMVAAIVAMVAGLSQMVSTARGSVVADPKVFV